VLRALLADELARTLGDRYRTLADQGAQWRPPEAAAVAVDALGQVLAAGGPAAR
jgi:hypothetical protein